MEYPAIDFRKLLLEEKKKARERRKQQKESTKTEQTLDKEASTERPIVAEWKLSLDTCQVPTLDRSEHCVCQDPPSIFYLPSYLPVDYQTALQEWLEKLPTNPVTPKNDEQSALGYWNELPYARRRVALFDSRKEDFPEPLASLVNMLVQTNVFNNPGPNHILINDYAADQGIMPHTDGPAYHSRTVTLSLGGEVLLDFTKRRLDNDKETSLTKASPVQVLLHAGSLVVFEDEAYSDYMHSIDDTMEEIAGKDCVNAQVGTPVQRNHRMSLTFRAKND